MTIRAKLVSQALATTGTTQTLTGAGFTPNIVIGMLQPIISSGGIADAMYAFGAAKSASSRMCHYMSSQDAQPVSDCGMGYRTDSFIKIVDPDGGIKCNLDMDSFTSDGCVLSFTTVPIDTFLLHTLYLTEDIGGIQSFIGQMICNTAIGNQDVTGLGFDNPDCVIFHIGGSSSAGPNNDAPNAPVTSTFGFAAQPDASSPVTQSCSLIRILHAADTTNTRRVYRTDRCIHLESETSTLLSASYVGGVTGGFRVNIATTSGVAWRIGVIALKGINAHVVNATGSTTTGTTGNVITGVPFKPTAMIVNSASSTAGTAAVDTAKRSIGMATSASARACCSIADTDNIPQSNASSHMNIGAVVQNIDANHGTPTTVDRFDFNGFTSDGATLDHEVASGTAIDFSILFLGPDAASPQAISPTGIASGLVFGTANVFTGSQAQAISPAGIASGQAFGVPTIGSTNIIRPTSILSSDASDVVITGIFDEGAFDPSFTQYKVDLITGPDPRSTFVPFGTTSVTFTKVLNGSYTARWMLADAAGTTTTQIQTVAINVTNFGRPTLVIGGGGGSAIIQVTGIPSSEAFGMPSINRVIITTGIASGEAFGNPTLVTGGLAIVGAGGIVSGEAFGVPIILSGQDILPLGITSGEAFGIPLVEFEGAQLIALNGLNSDEQFGTATVSVGAAPIQWPPITDPDTVWIRIPPGREG